jgi:hypothetical protein
MARRNMLMRAVGMTRGLDFNGRINQEWTKAHMAQDLAQAWVRS